MEKLKSVLADKILEISEKGDDGVQSKLDKINHFKTFTDACKSLVEKYPTIEREFIDMVDQNDFDTKTASARVDAVIKSVEGNKHTDTSKIEEIKGEIIEDTEKVAEKIKDFFIDKDSKDTSIHPEITPKPPVKEKTEEDEDTGGTIKKILIACGVILILILAYIVVKWSIVLINWVMTHLSLITWSLGGIIVTALIIWISIKSYSKKK